MALYIKGKNEDTRFECVCADLMNEASGDWSDSPQCLSFLSSSLIPLLLTCLSTSVMQFCVSELNAVSGFRTVNVCPLVKNWNESNNKTNTIPHKKKIHNILWVLQTLHPLPFQSLHFFKVFKSCLLSLQTVI